ncbi:hypothetical protein Mal64_22440 [Pseudobythopirellula maris]|uniref:Uncharacterized protein n=1 Tax=Pseudobythopirellula maris TaxID=2527991 RepID=A0A5C5ZNQ0_9BACT|nr:hypothetical protein [Pseudobythopirellula maris]TWT88756.1 hypothetical protein Mal64_22440 [Pseudobythopirellula maris]
MTETNPATRSPWLINDDHHVELSCGACNATLDLADPASGVSALCFDGHAVEGALWRVTLGERPQLAESYARGADLVAVYDPTEGFPFRTRLVWECEALDRGVRLTLTCSVQTHLLDTSPQLGVASDLGAELIDAEQRDADAGAMPLGARWLCRGGAAGVACFEAAHPADLSGALIEPLGAEGRRSLGTAFLEKGVICCGRLVALVLPPDARLADALPHYERFVAAELPLTT